MTRAVGALCVLPFLALLVSTNHVIAQEDVGPAHGPGPIWNGQNHQPRQDQLDALHQNDVTAKDSQKIERLYEQLEQTSPHQPAPSHKGK
jgi:hypothetical protein